MSVTAESVTWNETRSPAEVVASAQSNGAKFLVIEPETGWTSPQLLERASATRAATNLLVICDPRSPARQLRLNDNIPSFLALLAVLPDRDSSVTVDINNIARDASHCSSLCQLAVRASAVYAAEFVENSNRLESRYPFPSLTSSSSSAPLQWLREIIDQVKLPGASATQMAAVRAGLFLLNDFFDDSHECSQSIEGMGPFHTGDYWHAILHRREPDYGNSKYWFRHVGRHPAFDEVARRVQLLRAPQKVMSQLIPDGQWDPFAFVDLCASAERDNSLVDICEQIQFQEMLALFEFICREALERRGSA